MPQGKICPVDGRRFKTKRALNQHALAAHSKRAARPGAGKSSAMAVARSGQSTVNPRGRAFNKSSPGKNTSAGSDLLGVFQIKSETKPGTHIVATSLGPNILTPSRFNSESILYTRWKPLFFRFTISCNGSFSTFGSIIAGWCMDSSYQRSADGTGSLIRAAALRPSVSCRLNERISFVIPVETATRWLLCDGEVDLSCHGTLVVITSSQTGGYTGSLSMTVGYDWKVQFEGVEMPAMTVSLETITWDAGWHGPVFSTSDDAWNKSKLTLKETPGGSMIPFSSGRADAVYQAADGQPQVYYKLADGKQAIVKYFAIIQSYHTKGFACFADKAKADAYVLEGDEANVLDYHSGSNWSDCSKWKISHFPKKEVQNPSPQLRLAKLETAASQLAVKLENSGLLQDESVTDRISELESKVDRLTSLIEKLAIQQDSDCEVLSTKEDFCEQA